MSSAARPVFIPTAFNTTFTFTPTGGSPMPETDTSSKAAPDRTDDHLHDSASDALLGPEGMATIQGTVTGFFTPR